MASVKEVELEDREMKIIDCGIIVILKTRLLTSLNILEYSHIESYCVHVSAHQTKVIRGPRSEQYIHYSTGFK